MPNHPIRKCDITAYAPGKLILSGEHAVVYGAPALAMALDCHAVVNITQHALPHFALHLTDIAHHSRLTLQRLRHVKSRIKEKYQRFIHGDVPIHRVLQKPFELAQFALSLLSDKPSFALPNGAKINIQSRIPIGCGLGSSAAMIVCMLRAVSQYLEITLSEETLFQLALIAENTQHGQSSGLDLKVVIQGGCLYMHQQTTASRTMHMPTLWLAHTGTPIVSTGECVTTVAKRFQSSQLIRDFTTVTQAIDHALQTESRASLIENIRFNHQLLMHIGVVPEIVQAFVREIEAAGGAAKICGAGAVRGAGAGMVLVIGHTEGDLQRIAKRFHYPLKQATCEERGAYVA